MPHTSPPSAAAPLVRPVEAWSWRGGKRADVLTAMTETVAEEVPIALIYNGIRLVGRLMTPSCRECSRFGVRQYFRYKMPGASPSSEA